MPGYLLMRDEHPHFVALARHERSYVTRDKAHIFPTREAAEAERRDNESIVQASRWPT